LVIPSKAAYAIDPLPELLKQQQHLDWTIEHWLESGTLGVVVGPEGSFKSFLVSDWGMSVATDREWQGMRVKPGRVLFIAGEGRTGLIRRMRGWCMHHEAVADQLYLGRSPIELIGPEDAERIAELGQFALVVIDTLARNFGPGSENDQRDMSEAVKNADRIREATGAAVLLVHHTPLEGREEGKLRPRGSSALAGAADAIFTVQFDKASKVVTVSSIKQKDAPNPETKFLSFEVVDLGERDNFDNEIATIVLCDTQKRPVAKTPLGKNQKRLIQELRARANGSRELLIAIRDITGGMDLPSRQGRIDLEKWFNEQPWSRPSVGGHIVDLERLPNA
jgi:hypothetical protein